MESIRVDKSPSKENLEELGVAEWDIWTKEASTFSWRYDVKETCYILEGEVIVTPEGGNPVAIGKGDLVVFPAGMSCVWEVRSPIRKHYKFG
ncbi:MAG TPA: cupin domain-containing protein [Acidobacteriota bacterium]|nr:cupin domain-containing protein [Acidobacteriota bacterium]